MLHEILSTIKHRSIFPIFRASRGQKPEAKRGPVIRAKVRKLVKAQWYARKKLFMVCTRGT